MQDQENGFRLSPRQRELWAFRNEHAADRAQLAILIEGPLKKEQLEQALQQVVKRHEILRTNFRQVASLKAAVQIITEHRSISAQQVDLSQLSRAEQAATCAELFQRAGQRMFNHEQEPPLRASLLSLSPETHLLYVSLLSLCADARTLRNIADEISRAYALGLKGLELSDEPLQYVSFAEWHNELLELEESPAARQYWRRQQNAGARALKFPFELERRIKGRFQPASHTLKIDGETLARIGKAANAQQATTATFLLACWQLLISRLTGQSEVVVGVTHSGRKYEELENAMGAFARTIPVVCRLDRNMPFRTFLGLTSEAVSEAVDWHEYFKPEQYPPVHAREPGEPDFPFTFELVEWPAQFSAADLTFSLYRQLVCLEQFKVKLSALLRGDDLIIEFQYDAGLFDEQGISRVAGQFSTLVLSALADGEATIGALEILSEAERRQMLVEWNDTKVEYAAERCAQQLFEAQVALTPHNIAVEFAGERLSYAEVNARANQLAHYLRGLNVGPDVLVGLMMHRSLDMVIALMAVLKAGGAYVPLDLSYPQERLAFILEDAGVNVVLTEESLRGRLPEEIAGCVVCVVSERTSWEMESTADVRSGANSENLAYVIYTSGSTGRPKGVMISHKGLVNYLSWCTNAYAVQQGSGSPVHSPLGFDLTVTSLLAPLTAGQSVLLLDEEQGLDGLVSALRRRGEFSLVKLTPAHLEILSQMAAPEETAGWTRAFVIGGEALFEQNLTFWQRHAPATRLINEYGPTETVVGCCVYEVTGELQGLGIVPIGRPIANTQVYLLDERMNPAPVGVAGELYIGGHGLARGYLHRPELTAERFVPHPFSAAPGARLYRSGDSARYRGDGLIEYLGRGDQQVKVRGYRIELGEIEVVLGCLAGVREAVVAVRADAAGDSQLVAYITGEAEAGELERQLRQQLPEYMIPATFVFLPKLPVTPNGKVDRTALPAPDDAQQKSKKAFIAPRDVLELELARTWREVLNQHSVGMRDNFFELGGHSILAARLMARIYQQFGHRLPLTTLFQDATIEHLARILRRQAKPAARLPSLVMIQPGLSRPPFFSVHPSGGNVLCYAELARHLGPDQPVYGLQAQSLDGVADFQPSIEEMAVHYLTELRTVQSVGPYFLGGWSFGGLVAFEMARQLRAQAQEVALLALIDTRLPTPQDSLMRIDEVVLMSNFAADLGLTLDNLKVSPAELLLLEPDQQLAYVLEIATKANILPPDLDLLDVRRLYQVFKINVRAMRSYRPTPADCCVTLFQAAESLASARQDAARGWHELALAGVEIHTVPGNHFDMVREPHVKVLAERLRACLEAAPILV